MQEFTGRDYVKIDIANQYGLDRLTWYERIHWVDDNRPQLSTMTSQSKNELAFDKGIRALDAGDRQIPTNHIMGMDATASGVQMMAAMSGCRSSAETVNLINTGNREDLYQNVAEEMSEHLGMTVTRDTVKKPVMTFFYGSLATPKRVFGEGDGLQAFYKAMQSKLPGPYELMTMFQQYWDPTATSYQWAMPDGHVCHVPVSSTEEKGLEIDEADHLRFTYRADVVQPQPAGRALAANIVHSVDAWVCRQMVTKAKALGFRIAPIHDCFYAHPNNMNDVRQMYRECLAAVADMNLVTAILTQIHGMKVPYSKISSGLSKDIMLSEYALS